MSYLREEIKKIKRKKKVKGREKLIRFANGERLTRKQAIWAYCCMYG